MFARRFLMLALAAAVGLAVGACGKKTEDGKVMRAVNGEAITESDYNHYLRLRQGESIPDKDKEREVVLNELTDRVLLTQRATELGVDRDPDVKFAVARAKENILIQALIRKTVRDNPVTDDDLKARYQQEVDKTNKTEFRVRHILVKTEDEAKEIVKQLQHGAKFAALAKSKSIDKESGHAGGELGWINQGMVVPEFFDGVLATKKGAISAPVKSDYGWHIIMVEDSRPLKVPTFEEVLANPQAKAGLVQKIQNERLTALLDDLKKKAKITND
jgi:peptidyl-prolyl cis-trans isomerase C